MNKITPINYSTSVQPIPSTFNDGFSQYEAISKLIQIVNEQITTGNLNIIETQGLKTLVESLQSLIDTNLSNDVITLLNDFKTNYPGIIDGALNDIESFKNETTNTVNSFSGQLKDMTNYYYVPNSMKAVDGTAGINAETIKSADIYALYDSLLSQYPSYITKTDLGLDASGTLHVYKYEFSPNKPQYKVVLGANIHGPGTGGDPKDVAITLYNFMKEITTNWDDDKALALMRWQVKFVVIPIENPWGYDNNKRQNYNGVDLNRNFDYAWASFVPSQNYAFGHDYKGTAAFSEPETRYIRDVLTANSDAICYYDFHAYMGIDNFYYPYAGEVDSPCSVLAYNITNYLKNKYNIDSQIVDTYTNNPQGFIYAYRVLGIPSCNPEFVVYALNQTYHNADIMTKMLEWYGNFVWCHIQRFSSKTVSRPEIRYAQLWYKRGDSDLPDIFVNTIGGAGVGTAVEVPSLAFENDYGVDGIAKVEIRVNVRNATATTNDQSFLTPIVYQYNSPRFSQNSAMSEFQNRWEVYWDGANRMPISMIVEIPIFKSGGKLHVGLGGYISAGSCQIYRYLVNVTIIPTDKSNRASDLRAMSTGWQERLT